MLKLFGIFLIAFGSMLMLASSADCQSISVSPSSVTGGSYNTFTVTTTPPGAFVYVCAQTSMGCAIFQYRYFYDYVVVWDEPAPGTDTATVFVQAVAQPMTINFNTLNSSASVTVLPPQPFIASADNTTIVGDGSASPGAHVTLSTQGLFDPVQGVKFFATGSDPCLLSVTGQNGWAQSDPCTLIVTPGMGVELAETDPVVGPPAPLSVESWPVYAGTVTQPTDVTLTLAYQICVTQAPPCYPGDGYLSARVIFHLVPPPASDLGPCTECEAAAGQPVNLSTGDIWVSKTDYSVPGLAGGLSLTRTWNSLWNQTSPPFAAGMFGIGWTSELEERLQVLPNGNVKYWRGSGNTWTFQPLGCSGCASSLITPPNEHATVSFNSSTSQYTITLADGTTKTFNGSGYLSAVADRNGNTTAITYDGSNRITRVAAPGGQSLTFTYGLAQDPSRVTTIQDAIGPVATYSYSNSLLTSATYGDGGQNNYFYDAANNIVSVTDDQGKVIETHTYDGSNRGLTSARANGADSVTIQYGSNGSTTLTDSMNHTTTYSYSTISGSNYMTGIQGPGCDSCGGRNNQSFGLDASGNRQSSTDPNGNTVSFTYDSSDNVLTRTDAVGTWTYTYNGFNEVLTAKDPLGNTTTNTYDAKGNLLTTTTPSPDGGHTAGSKTTFTYDTKGQLQTITDPLTHRTTVAYFSTGLIQTITDAQTNATTYTYDGRGNRLTVKDALGKITTFTYDVMNRLMKITYPDNSITQFAYDKRGRRTSVTDANTKTTAYAYDDADRLTAVTDAATNTTQYGYDSENNLISITDALTRTTSFNYDFLGRVTKTLFPSNFFETYSYDNNGNLTSKTDRNSHSITYTYDQLNRLMQKSYPDSTSVTYTYDSDSRLTQVADPTGTYQLTFDDMGRLTQSTNHYSFLSAKTFTAAYGYDAASNRTSFTDPEGGATSYAYDTLNRLQTLTPPTAFVRGSFGYSYDALSRRTQMTRPNKVNTSYTYDSLSRLLSVTHATSKATLDGASYVVDAAGNRTTRTTLPSNTATNYGYDAIYELLSATQGSTTKESYSYDVTGNRLSALGSSGWGYNLSNELTSRPGVTYTYDNNGNTLTKTDSTGTTNYTWDFENRLISVTLPGSGGTVSFAYDPFGRRIKKVTSTTTSVFAYDGDNLVEETNASGAVVARYEDTQNIDEPLAMLRSSATSYFHADGLSSITSLSTAAGSIANTYTYDSFGKLTASTGSLVNPFQYTARESDSETGLYYYRARYYDPNAGRFLSEDPIGFSGGDLNLYAYVGGSPTNKIDPSGHQLICPFWSPGCVMDAQRLSNCAKGVLQPYFPGLSMDDIVLTPHMPGVTSDAPINVGAITLNGIISYAPGQFSGDAAGLAAIGHEITHVQQQNSGIVSFLTGYLGEYLKNLAHGNNGQDAYANISVEKEARAMENRIFNDLFHAHKFDTICKDYCQAVKQPDSPW